jgi:hypothetical protein
MTFPGAICFRGGTCLCCIAGATFVATNGWLTPPKPAGGPRAS